MNDWELPAEPASEPEAGPETESEAGFQGGPEAGRETGSAYDPAAPAPLNVPRTPTGNAEVDAQLDRLADADHLAADGHIEVYEDVHRGLRDALTALDARQGPSGPPGPPAPYGMNNRS
ncbi:hypothetical protein [Streptomyces flaveus]|jgi:hypothetical protein|uniref:hypothetical protein n=1 Tax=Streptomyces flaveus TaxID=66370 RepID=UPI00332008F6